MTPLAYRIVKDMTLPVKRRIITPKLDPELVAHFRNEFHCFECSAIQQLAHDLKSQMLESFMPSVSGAFLPAERTWIEWSSPDDKWSDGRMGAMLVRRDNGFADVFVFSDSRAKRVFSTGRLGRVALADKLVKVAATLSNPEAPWNDEPRFIQLATSQPSDSRGFTLAWQLYAMLLLVNTPHVTTHTRNDPHRALARNILSNRKALGIFPLQAWTTITLTLGAIDMQEHSDTVTGTTGTVSLHWTRAHLRRVHGVWTLISDYWSGDGSLGIRQSRYKVEPPRHTVTP